MSLHSLSQSALSDLPGVADVDVLMAALDAMDCGVLVCDGRGRLLLCNRAARRELDEGEVLLISADGLLDVQGGVGLLSLRRAVHVAAMLRGYQLVPLRAGERTLMLSVQPLGGADGVPRALLMTGRRSLCPELAVRHLGRVFALTPAEVDVLGSLMAGVRISEMAKARGVQVSTVRTQVAALRAKLGVQRVDDITRMVAELPPMLGLASGHAAPVVPPRHRSAAGPQLSA